MIITTISDINKDFSFHLIVNDYEVAAIKKHFGNHEDIEDFDGFFVKVENGDYTALYGFEGIIPYLTKPVWNLQHLLHP